MSDLLPPLLFVATCFVLILGFPVAFSLGGTALLFAIVCAAFDLFDLRLLSGLGSRIFGIMTNAVLLAVPLFIFMGVTLQVSKLADELLIAMAGLLGSKRGGLAISVTLVGALLAASTGIVGATVVTMGLLSLPVMLKAGYDPKFACGSICAAGTLGQLIPPSILLVILGDVLQGANTQAQLALGNFAPDPVSVVDLFAGAAIPGLLLVGLYCAWQLVFTSGMPSISVSMAETRRSGWPLLGVLLPPLVLVVLVLGSILFGYATPTESAAIGAVGVLGLAILKNRMDLSNLKIIARRTAEITTMVFTILIGASIFTLVFRGLGGDQLIEQFLGGLPGGATSAMLVVMFTIFLLGFFLDFVEIVFVVVPIVGPAILAMGIDPIWFGVMVALNLQTSFLTPPFGLALFYLRGVAPDEVKTYDIYKGVIPFVAIQLFALCLVAIFPALAIWLPERLFG